MSLPVDTPTEFEVKKVVVKKTLPAKDGQKPATILKLGLIAPDGEKGWTEYFCRDGTTPPSEGSKETLVLTQPENPAWALKAARPRSGGMGPRRRDPAETRAIQRQHSQEMALRALAILRPDFKDQGDFEFQVRNWTDFFDADIANGKTA